MYRSVNEKHRGYSRETRTVTKHIHRSLCLAFYVLHFRNSILSVLLSAAESAQTTIILSLLATSNHLQPRYTAYQPLSIRPTRSIAYGAEDSL